jgi:uncharacterized protein with von Willebrand factor type A (vWA) domain
MIPVGEPCTRLDPSPGEPETPLTRLLGFTRLLRDNGFSLGLREQIDALSVARASGILNLQRLRWGLRSLLCTTREEWRRFDPLFDAYWFAANRTLRTQAAGGGRDATRSGTDAGTGRDDRAIDVDRAGSGTGVDDTHGAAARGGASPQEALGRLDFRFLGDARQMHEMERLAERLARRMRRRQLRRLRLSRQGRRIHMRRTIRKNLRYGGTPLELVFRQRRRQRPRLIVLLDVSRSMSLYSYLFLRFARGLVEAFRDAEVFVYHTRLVPVTQALREHDARKFREKLTLLSAGWAGGTRIGECLQAFNREHAARLVTSRSIVVIASDGFDTGPAEVLGGQLARLRRRVRKIVWLNPLLGRAGYQPLAAGMQAALPSIDVFAPAHNLDSLLALEPVLMSL